MIMTSPDQVPIIASVSVGGSCAPSAHRSTFTLVRVSLDLVTLEAHGR